MKKTIVAFTLVLMLGASTLGAVGKKAIEGPAVLSEPGHYYLVCDLEIADGTAIDIRADGVTLDLNGFTIRNHGQGNTIQQSVPGSVHITNGWVFGGAIGILLTGGSSSGTAWIEVDRVFVSGSGGILIAGSGDTRVRVEDNSVQGPREGIAVSGARGGSIARNLVFQSAWILIADGRDLTLEDNNVIKGIGLNQLHGATIRGNRADTIVVGGASSANLLEWNLGQSIAFSESTSDNTFANNRAVEFGIVDEGDNTDDGGNFLVTVSRGRETVQVPVPDPNLPPLTQSLGVSLSTCRGATLIDGPVAITEPGKFVVTRDISVSSGSAIEIRSPDVWLDLGGHTIANGGRAVTINQIERGNLRVTNGSVVGGSYGVRFEGGPIPGAGALYQADHLRIVGSSRFFWQARIVATGTGSEAFFRIEDNYIEDVLGNGIFYTENESGIVARNTILRSGPTPTGIGFFPAYGIYTTFGRRTLIHDNKTNTAVAAGGILGTLIRENRFGSFLLGIDSYGNAIDQNVAEAFYFGAGTYDNVYSGNTSSGGAIEDEGANYDGGNNL